MIEYYEKLLRIRTIEDEMQFMIRSDKHKMTAFKKVWVSPDIWDDQRAMHDEAHYLFIEFLDLDPVSRHQSFGPIKIPAMEITTGRENGNPLGERYPILKMIDGRHRFMVLKMLGAKHIPVAMRQPSIDIGNEFGIL
jgi:hypothetical protein